MTTLTAPANIEASEYFSAAGLSNSGMKDLAVSPLRYWHLHVNPNRPAPRETPEMALGHALHCAVLEPDQFDSRYACELEPPEDCLVTMDDLRQFLQTRDIKPKGTRKAEVIAQVQAHYPTAPILDVLTAEHEERHAGKTIFKREDWLCIAGMAQALRDEPNINVILADGEPEVPVFGVDPDTGILLKGKLDWVTPKVTLDIKTFSQKRGKSIDKSIADAIFYEQYYRQAYLYTTLRKINGQPDTDFVLAFVESEEPHEVRIRVLRPKLSGNLNLYWERARIECRELIRSYAASMKHFGLDHPWRYAQEITPLADEEMPQMAY